MNRFITFRCHARRRKQRVLHWQGSLQDCITHDSVRTYCLVPSSLSHILTLPFLKKSLSVPSSPPFFFARSGSARFLGPCGNSSTIFGANRCVNYLPIRNVRHIQHEHPIIIPCYIYNTCHNLPSKNFTIESMTQKKIATASGRIGMATTLNALACVCPLPSSLLPLL